MTLTYDTDESVSTIQSKVTKYALEMSFFMCVTFIWYFLLGEIQRQGQGQGYYFEAGTVAASEGSARTQERTKGFGSAPSEG